MIKTIIKKAIKKMKKSLFDNIFYYSKDIELHLQQVALKETWEYIVNNNLTRLMAFDSALDLIEFSVRSRSIEWLVLEFGVFKWSTINFIASLLPDTQVYWFDSFEWLPEDWRSNFMKWHFKLDWLPQVSSNVNLTKWWFNETLPDFGRSHNSPISLLHIDCDLYSSTKTIFDNLWQNITAWTIIIFDEFWNYFWWKEWEYKAFNEYIQLSWKKFEYIWYNQKHEQVAIRIL